MVRASGSILIAVGIMAILITVISYSELEVNKFIYSRRSNRTEDSVLYELRLLMESQSTKVASLLETQNTKMEYMKTQIDQNMLVISAIDKMHPMLDLEDLPKLAGPRTTAVDSSKSLVVICVGKNDKERVNKLLTQYFNDDTQFQLMLFLYDNTTWHEFEWYNRIGTVAIRVLHKMKFWYFKRFLPPNMARAFRYIIMLDADVDFDPPFDPILYLKIVSAFNIELSQPAHSRSSADSHRGIRTQNGKHIGRYRDFVECGPVVFLSSRGYQCIYELLQLDLTSGWGLDVLWADYLKSVCGFGPTSVGLLDVFTITHDKPTGHGTASGQPGFNDAANDELNEYMNRFPNVRQGWGRIQSAFGNRSCLHAANPSQLSC